MHVLKRFFTLHSKNLCPICPTRASSPRLAQPRNPEERHDKEEQEQCYPAEHDAIKEDDITMLTDSQREVLDRMLERKVPLTQIAEILGVGMTSIHRTVAATLTRDKVDAAVKDCSRDPPDLICPISLQLFVDPVNAPDGKTYERHFIEEYVRDARRSPNSREPMEPKFVCNAAMEAQVAEFRAKTFDAIMGLVACLLAAGYMDDAHKLLHRAETLMLTGDDDKRIRLLELTIQACPPDGEGLGMRHELAMLLAKQSQWSTICRRYHEFAASNFLQLLEVGKLEELYKLVAENTDMSLAKPYSADFSSVACQVGAVLATKLVFSMSAQTFFSMSAQTEEERKIYVVQVLQILLHNDQIALEDDVMHKFLNCLESIWDLMPPMEEWLELINTNWRRLLAFVEQCVDKSPEPRACIGKMLVFLAQQFREEGLMSEATSACRLRLKVDKDCNQAKREYLEILEHNFKNGISVDKHEFARLLASEKQLTRIVDAWDSLELEEDVLQNWEPHVLAPLLTALSGDTKRATVAALALAAAHERAGNLQDAHKLFRQAFAENSGNRTAETGMIRTATDVGQARATGLELLARLATSEPGLREQRLAAAVSLFDSHTCQQMHMLATQFEAKVQEQQVRFEANLLDMVAEKMDTLEVSLHKEQQCSEGKLSQKIDDANLSLARLVIHKTLEHHWDVSKTNWNGFQCGQLMTSAEFDFPALIQDTKMQFRLYPKGMNHVPSQCILFLQPESALTSRLTEFKVELHVDDQKAEIPETLNFVSLQGQPRYDRVSIKVRPRTVAS